jgi:hypothetical protein
MSANTMHMLGLADMENFTESQVKDYIASNFAGAREASYPTDGDVLKLRRELNKYKVLVAYVSVGAHGCDSSAWFLLLDKKKNTLSEIYGSHCSCYGFEGQWDSGPEETTAEFLMSKGFFFCGGYDDDCEVNKAKVSEFLQGMPR